MHVKHVHVGHASGYMHVAIFSLLSAIYYPYTIYAAARCAISGKIKSPLLSIYKKPLIQYLTVLYASRSKYHVKLNMLYFMQNCI